MREYRQKIVNVGCMGKFYINYYLDGDWEIIFSDKKSKMDYIASADTGNCFLPFWGEDETPASVQDWMWDAFMYDLKTLQTEVERDSIHTPYTVGTA